MAAPKKFAQELAKRIIHTKGMLTGDRQLAKRVLTGVAFEAEPLGTEPRRAALAVLQLAARDEQVWTALVAARAALGK